MTRPEKAKGDGLWVSHVWDLRTDVPEHYVRVSLEQRTQSLPAWARVSTVYEYLLYNSYTVRVDWIAAGKLQVHFPPTYPACSVRISPPSLTHVLSHVLE